MPTKALHTSPLQRTLSFCALNIIISCINNDDDSDGDDDDDGDGDGGGGDDDDDGSDGDGDGDGDDDGGGGADDAHRDVGQHCSLSVCLFCVM